MALLKPELVVVKTGVPVATPLLVAVMVWMMSVSATAPPTAAQELAVMPPKVNERNDAPVAAVMLVEPDDGGVTVVSTPLRVYATNAPEDPT